MAGSLGSDSSKTLSAARNSPNTLTSTLLTALSSSAHEFLPTSSVSESGARGSKSALQDAALVLAKQYMDPLAAAGCKRKARTSDEIYLDGFDIDQIWEQVKMVVDTVTMEESIVQRHNHIQTEATERARKKQKIDSIRTINDQTDSAESAEEESGSGIEMDSFDENEDVYIKRAGTTARSPDGLKLQVYNEEGDEVDEEEENSEADDEVNTGETHFAEFVEDKFGLNDGFFSIDDFNRQTELMEIEYAGEVGGENDEEYIDLHADPLRAQGVKGYQESQGDFEESEEGLEEDNANNVMYNDFFAPPARKKSKQQRKDRDMPRPWKQGRPVESGRELSQVESEMDRVRRDLFDDDEDEGSDLDTADGSSDPMARRSNHQKRQSALLEEIRQLERENVAKKQWTLAGEAKARDRPLNSLLEEDLEFERSGRPVPVITQDVTESLEDLVKRRILAVEFDEILRRRPDDIDPSFRRGRVEIDDSKPKEGLADVYEREHLKSVDPKNYRDTKDVQIEKEHQEIEDLFADVSRKLDALTNWHYTPKPPKPSLRIVADAPAISMEEAQPAAAGGAADAANVSLLAPQEVYRPRAGRAELSADGAGREVVIKSGAPVSTAEMTSDERKRRRRREKERIRKRSSGVESGKQGEKKDFVGTLKRGGVKLIGKDGESRNVDGTLVRCKNGGILSNALKL